MSETALHKTVNLNPPTIRYDGQRLFYNSVDITDGAADMKAVMCGLHNMAQGVLTLREKRIIIYTKRIFQHWIFLISLKKISQYIPHRQKICKEKMVQAKQLFRNNS